MSAIHRWNRDLQVDRARERQERLFSLREHPREQPPIDPLPRQQARFRDGFDTADKRAQDGLEAVGKRTPEELGTVDRLLTSKEFQQRLQETVEGTSARAEQVKQVESTYRAFWKDSQDFSVSKGPAVRVSEPWRYEAPAETAWKGRALTVPEFKVPVVGVAESVRVQQAAQATAAVLEARRTSAVAEQPFTLLGRAALRG